MKYSRESIGEKLKKERLIPVLTVNNPENAVPVCLALAGAGLGSAEITMRTSCAVEAIGRVRRAVSDGELPEDFLIIAGTVLSAGDAEKATSAGAEGIVSPGFDASLVRWCRENDVPYFPGVSTATELTAAVKEGITLVKFFPASAAGGTAALRALSAPFPGVSFMPTGGINEKNLRDYLALPSVICCGGSFMCGKGIPDPAEVRRRVDEAFGTGRSGEPAFAGKDGPVCGFGEIMMRLSPPDGFVKLRDAKTFDVCCGGSEANTLALLSAFGEKTEFVSAVPEGAAGDCAISALLRAGVGTGAVIRKKGRLGIYYLEKGIDLLPSSVTYDRAGSLFALTGVSEWLSAMPEKCGWFHFSGITPALSDDACEALGAAVRSAKKTGIPVSCDINYRSALWTKEKAAAVLAPLIEGIDLCIINEEAAEMFGVRGEGGDRVQAAADACRVFAGKFSIGKTAATVRRTYTQETNGLCAVCYDSASGETAATPERRFSVTDRVGSGDCFGGGMIYATRRGYGLRKSLDFALACCVVKHYCRGDMPAFSLEDARAIAGRSYGDGDTGALIRR